MIKIKDFTVAIDNPFTLIFHHNDSKYKVLLKDVCDALAEQRLGVKANNKVEEMFLAESKKGYSIALQEIKWNMLEQVKSFEVEESNFSLGELVTYKDNFVEPYNVELK